MVLACTPGRDTLGFFMYLEENDVLFDAFPFAFGAAMSICIYVLFFCYTKVRSNPGNSKESSNLFLLFSCFSSKIKL